MGQLKSKIFYTIFGAVISSVSIGAFWIGEKVKEMLDSIFIERYNCYIGEDVPPERYAFLHDGDFISISVNGNEEDNAVLVSAAERAVENVNNYIEANNLNLPPLRIISDKEAQIRITDIDSYINNAINDGFDGRELSVINKVGTLPYFGSYAITNYNNLYNGLLEDELVVHHANIFIRNYSVFSSIPNGPIILPFFSDQGGSRKFIVSDLQGNILCVNTTDNLVDDLPDNYTVCTDDDLFKVYSRTIEHEIMHALGVEAHDCSATFDELLEDDLDSITGYSDINIMSRPYTYTITLENGEDIQFRIFSLEEGNFSAERLMEVHGVK